MMIILQISYRLGFCGIDCGDVVYYGVSMSGTFLCHSYNAAQTTLSLTYMEYTGYILSSYRADIHSYIHLQARCKWYTVKHNNIKPSFEPD